MGDNAVLGEDVWLLNLEQITIGSDVCLSQGAFLCTGSHNHATPDFAYDNAPITVEDGVWVAAQALVLRGVTIGTGSVVGARAVIRHDVPPWTTVRVNTVH
jgi:putative colanic acid biosynthesis acetyltransferase WcaF